MNIWKKDLSVDLVNEMNLDTAADSLGIKVTKIGKDFVEATMPVDKRTKQIHGVLHGGASVLLAETVGSLAGHLATREGLSIVGLDINANHLASASKGYVKAIAKPLHLGSKTHVWEIKITSEENDKLICISRLTLFIIEVNKK